MFKAKMAQAVRRIVWLIATVFLHVRSASPEETQANTTTTIVIPTRDIELHLKLTPGTFEGIHQESIAKVFYELEPVTPEKHLPIFQEGITIQVRSRDRHIAVVEEPAEFTLYPSTKGSPASNDSFIRVRGLFLGRTALHFFIPRSQALIVEAPSVSPHFDADHIGVGTAAASATNYGSNNSTNHPQNSQNTTDIVYTQTIVHIPINDGPSHDWFQLETEYYISVIRLEKIVDHLFLVVIIIIFFFANVGMGCKIDLSVIKEVLRRPIPPGIGLFCQYLVMPLLSFALIKMLRLEGGVALGMFATGCAPGGGASNMYTYLLKGDVSLSVTMTFISTMSALGLIPFWLFTLGKVILSSADSKRICIPYTNIIYSLLVILVPVGIGILIEHFKPRWSKFIRKTLRPIFLFFIIFIFTFGVYAKLFIFKLFTGKLVTAGILLPYVGFLLGGVLAFLCKQSWERVKTIAVETGIQNTGVAYLVLTFTLPQPEADLSMVSPIIVATFTPIPLMIAIAIIEYRHRCLKKSDGDQELQSPITEEATFDQTAQAKALVNGCQGGNGEAEPKQNGSTTDHPLIDNSHNTTDT